MCPARYLPFVEEELREIAQTVTRDMALREDAQTRKYAMVDDRLIGPATPDVVLVLFGAVDPAAPGVRALVDAGPSPEST